MIWAARAAWAAAWLLAATWAQQVQLHGINHHPAAGPDLVQHDLAALFDSQFLTAPDGRVEGVVDDPRKLIDPLKQHQKFREEQLLREREEIDRVLSAPSTAPTAPSSSLSSVPFSAWIGSIIGCLAVVACGIVPAFLLPKNSGEFLQSDAGRRQLNLLLSFAVGSLLGDVFLHLLPETWSRTDVDMDALALWTLAGLLVCFFVEKLCAHTEESQHKACAIMNLVANIVDNFTHGLAVGASFLVSTKCGVLTTCAILLHEIPHEVSDFAILLRADFDRWSAVKAQAVTASAGVLGSVAALALHADSSLGGAAQWVLPFTAGGFVNIALAQILPELMREADPRQNIKQLALILGGVAVMGALNNIQL